MITSNLQTLALANNFHRKRTKNIPSMYLQGGTDPQNVFSPRASMTTRWTFGALDAFSLKY